MFKDFPWDKSCNECSGKHHTILNEDNGTRVINKNTSSKIVQITGGTRSTSSCRVVFGRPKSLNIRLA